KWSSYPPNTLRASMRSRSSSAPNRERTTMQRELPSMIIGLEGFGSIWSVRSGPKCERAFYNTTGIVSDGKLRHRSWVFGQLRFNEAGGFNPNHLELKIGRVFESAG